MFPGREIAAAPAAVRTPAEVMFVTVYVEDWQAAFGSPYLVAPEEAVTARVTLVEDGNRMERHRPDPPDRDVSLAFIDGVRRGEASLYQENPVGGQLARGVAGTHACGAVIAAGDRRLEFSRITVQRLVIWGSGLRARLPDVAGGWSWTAHSIADPAPDAPLKELQTRMRQAEGHLAEELGQEGFLVIVDGPLNYVRSRDLPVVGYIKTHHRALLEPPHHARITGLASGERSSLFALGDDRYSCYLRLAPVRAFAGPWAGIVRIEIPQSAGFEQAVEMADHVTALVPRFAGVPHRDPRAPQNLQPVGALEKQLRHRMGDGGLAFRAVREAVLKLGEREVA